MNSSYMKENMSSFYHFTEEETKDLYWHQEPGISWGHWYNMDVSNLPRRPNSERYDWNNKNYWLKQYHRSRNTIISFVFSMLDKAGFITPQRLTALGAQNEKRMWVHDTCFDLSHIPEYVLGLKAGLDCRRQFDFMRDGAWYAYCEAHILVGMGKYDLAEKYLYDEIASRISIHNSVNAAMKRSPTPPPPPAKWIADMLSDLGARKRIS